MADRRIIEDTGIFRRVEQTGSIPASMFPTKDELLEQLNQEAQTVLENPVSEGQFRDAEHVVNLIRGIRDHPERFDERTWYYLGQHAERMRVRKHEPAAKMGKRTRKNQQNRQKKAYPPEEITRHHADVWEKWQEEYVKGVSKTKADATTANRTGYSASQVKKIRLQREKETG